MRVGSHVRAYGGNGQGAPRFPALLTPPARRPQIGIAKEIPARGLRGWQRDGKV